MDESETGPSIDSGSDRAGAPPERAEAQQPSYLRRLLHRWFVEYNPLYLVSALLVLGGLTAVSRSTAASSSVPVQVGAVAAIAEIYAFALIAGAALLTRIGLRRPAVMLCLVAALYQGDLTLLTERQVYLGWAGVLAAGVWFSLFVIKIRALAWAMRLRLSRSAVAVPAFGAFGMVVLPHVLQHLVTEGRSVVVAVWVFALFAAGLWSRREVSSIVDLDTWGNTVLRRARSATWALWAAIVLMHVLFWCSELSVSPAVLVPVAVLLATRVMRAEASVWCAATGVVLYVGVASPRSLWVVALLAAAALALRALRKPTLLERGPVSAPDATPYRAPGVEGAAAPTPEMTTAFLRSERASMARLLGGSFVGVYLAVWTFGWVGGALPHMLWLDALLAAAAIMTARRAPAPVLIPAAALSWLHAGVEAGIISAPSTAFSWGILSVGSGFALLLGSLAIAWKLRGEAAPVSAGDGVSSRR